MLKKRIIFTLLYDSGKFMLSRNFRLQKVGDLSWLQKNYNFDQISFYIDELIVLDVTRGKNDIEAFSNTLRDLTANCFVPISAGGGIRNVNQARKLLQSGSDKIVLNTPLFEQHEFVKELVSEFGQQCIVGSVDMKISLDGKYEIMTNNGSQRVEEDATKKLSQICNNLIGELYLNSIDRDGTGQGYDLSLLDLVPLDCSVPVILAGGVGNEAHLSVGFKDQRVDAVATAHLFNFIGDGLKNARTSMVNSGASLASWPSINTLDLSLKT
jgi:imidazole glycerol-phosphate synthase subunit HisF